MHARDSLCLPLDVIRKLELPVIRIREEEPSFWVRSRYVERGCDGKRFFLVHPDDAHDKRGREFVCEHEILTD